MDLAELGGYIRMVRKKAGLTQAQLALQGGVCRAVVNQLENGGIPDLGVRKIMRLCSVLGLSLTASPADEPPVLGDGTFADEEQS